MQCRGIFLLLENCKKTPRLTGSLDHVPATGSGPSHACGADGFRIALAGFWDLGRSSCEQTGGEVFQERESFVPCRPVSSISRGDAVLPGYQPPWTVLSVR